MGRARRQQGRSAVVLPGHTPAPAPDAGPAHFVEALGHRRPRAGRALGPGTRHAAGRRRASNDPVHGARRLHGAGRRRDAGRAVRACGHDLEAAFRATSRSASRAARAWSGPRARWAGCITRAASNAPCAIRCGPAAASPSSRTRCNGSTAGKWSNASRDPSSHKNRHRRRRHEARIDPRRRPHCRNTRRRASRAPPPRRRVGRHAAGAVRARRRRAAKPVDIGFIGTLSTPAGYIGEDERDAFMLAVQEGGGKLGGCRQRARRGRRARRPTPSRAPTGWCRAACACSPA